MTKAAPARELRVCLVSAHPLFLRQFQPLLADGFRVDALRLDAGARPEAQVGSLTAAELYVIDTDSLQQAQPVLSAIFTRQPEAHLLVLADSISEENAFALLRLGVKGLLSYAEAPQQLARAARDVAAGGFWVPRALLSRFVDFILQNGAHHRSVKGVADLSRREREVMDCLLSNLSNKEIASKLNIAERTAKFHVSNLLAKFGVQRRADLIVLCYQERSDVGNERAKVPLVN